MNKPDINKVFYLASPYSSAPPWYLKDEKWLVKPQVRNKVDGTLRVNTEGEWLVGDNYEPIPGISNQHNHEFKKMLIDIRHREIQAIAAKLLLDGYILIEPIGSCHFKEQHFSLPATYDYWKRRDRALIEHSDGVIVAMMPGWDQSTGVTDEIKHALQLGKEVWFLSMDSYEFKTHEELFTKRLEALKKMIEESQLQGNYEPYDGMGG